MGLDGYSSKPLVAGTLVGYKWLTVDSAGELFGPTFPQPVEVGENLASCQSASSIQAWYHGQAHEVFSPKKPFPQWLRLRRPRFSAHPAPWAGCGCGYWVMTQDPTMISYGTKSSNALLCAVEGYGRCVLGPLGFRAQKMKVLAVCAQRPASVPQPAMRVGLSPNGTAEMIVAEGVSGDWPRLAQRAAHRYGVEVINTQRALRTRFPASNTEEMVSLPTESSDHETRSQP